MTRADFSVSGVPTAKAGTSDMLLVGAQWDDANPSLTKALPERVEWPEVSRGDEVSIETPFEPLQVFLIDHATVNEYGVPDDASSNLSSCEPRMAESRDNTCSFWIDDSTGQVRVSLPTDVDRYLVVQAKWRLVNDGSVAASWAVEVSGQ
ncbi:hypothetical protein [Rhodococcoides corynebacterioides]|uniref:hypothetical protein n=1 Tax=Rhodococcoides corynebacterioides TaxID=53972 RepID=UPI001C9B84F5|nr:hypothetical protein [Rhodococcus corynebacterioides]MBY6364845.1 hypothetical protein [Rhodococcus corynebacterioides]